MNYNFFVLILVFFISLMLNKFLIKNSHYLKLTDKPNSRSLHKVEKSRAGGVAIFLAFVFGLSLTHVEISLSLVLSFFIIFSLGVYDDIKTSSSKTKFFWIAVGASLLYYDGWYIDSIGVFAGVDFIMPNLIAYLFLLFAVVGFINAMNLIDGLDGLSAGIGIVILISFAYIGFKYQDQFLFYTSMVLIASLLGFFVLNWYPSKIFMGDAGSLTLGFVILILSIHSTNQHYVSAVSILLLTAAPILDTLIVMTRRVV